MEVDAVTDNSNAPDRQDDIPEFLKVENRVPLTPELQAKQVKVDLPSEQQKSGAVIKMPASGKDASAIINAEPADTVGAEIEFHPLADIFPPMEGADFEALVVDIKVNGLHEPIVIHEGKIPDGRNRYRACVAAGIEYALTLYRGDDPAGFVVSANIHRRHLTQKQRRDFVAELVKAAPERSDNATAKLAKVSDKTVTKVRKELEGRSEIPNVSKRTDTKGRAQPAKRAKAEKTVKTMPAVELSTNSIGSTTTNSMEPKPVPPAELAEDRPDGSRVPCANSFDPVAWWNKHSVDERRTYLEGIKFEDWLEALPPAWKNGIERRVISSLAAKFTSAKAKPAIKAIQKLVEDDAKLLAMAHAGTA